MGHYAKVPTITDGKGVVENVITITAEELQTGLWGDPLLWVKTSYNTRGGVYYEPNSDTRAADQSKALRANYAGIGYTYDAVNDVFYAPQPFPSWVISPPSWLWEAPVPYPTDGKIYYWDEATVSWVLADPQP